MPDIVRGRSGGGVPVADSVLLGSGGGGEEAFEIDASSANSSPAVLKRAFGFELSALRYAPSSAA